jgi:hypothetical protein
MPAAASYTPPRSRIWKETETQPQLISWAEARIAIVAIATVLAVAFRVSALSTYGFSEDELNKVQAVEEYRAGHFSANAEHPMLMKLAMWGSAALANEWNRIVPPDQSIPAETAFRLPNAIAGAATTVALFVLADLLFGPAVGVVASVIWAFDVNAIAINRIGKEDTFLLLFFLLGIVFYERAKRIGRVSETSARTTAQTWYTLSGATFGLMFASKYMPHFLGIYALFNLLTDPNPASNKPHRLRHFGAMGAAFLAANAAILLPATWRYIPSYVQGDMLMHHGYLYNGAMYVTDVVISPLGVPFTYYLRLLATKVPLVVLAALIPGVIELVRRREERGFVFLRVLAVFFIVPYSLMAPKFLRYSLPMLATVDLIAAVGLVSGISWLLRKGWLTRATKWSVAPAAVVVFFSGLLVAERSAPPFYSLFRNEIGMRLDPALTTFPEQTYDYGVRESVAAIAAVAEPTAVIATDAPVVAAHYVRLDGRPDIEVRSLSESGMSSGPHQGWVIVQDEHRSFENELIVEQLRARAKPWAEFRMAEVVAAQVFRLEEK